jgi:acyl carrier protein
VSDDQIKHELLEVMREAFRKPALEFTPDLHMREIFGIDSILFVTLILSVEEKFDVMLDEERVDQLSDMNSLLALVRDSMAAKA